MGSEKRGTMIALEKKRVCRKGFLKARVGFNEEL